MRSLGREGLRDLIDGNIVQAERIAEAMAGIGYAIPVPPRLNQVLALAATDGQTRAICRSVQRSGAGWFGMTRWNGRDAMRISLSSHRATNADVNVLIAALTHAYRNVSE